MIGPNVLETFQGPKGNATEEIWLVKKGLIVMLGRMDDEVLDPSGGM